MMNSARKTTCGALIGSLLTIAGMAIGGPVVADPEPAAPTVAITYLANEGFLIEAGSKKILIDALFDGEGINWCHVNGPDTLAKLEQAEAPFDDIDLILATHRHPDHFSATTVKKHLAADEGSVFIGPPQAVKLMRENGLGENPPSGKAPEVKAPKQDRIREVDLELFASATIEFDGVRIEAHRMHHSQFIDKDDETGEETNRHKDVENLAYLIEIAGMRLLHVGDALLPLNREYVGSSRFPGGPIDILFLEYFDYSEETKKLLEPLRPGHIVFMHLPPQPETIEKLGEYLWWNFPNAVLFQKPLEKRTLTSSAPKR